MVDDLERILTDERAATRLLAFCAALMFYPFWRLIMLAGGKQYGVHTVIDEEYNS